jgi:hypothetical protein
VTTWFGMGLHLTTAPRDLLLRTSQSYTWTCAFCRLLKLNPEIVFEHRLQLSKDFDPPVVHHFILIAFDCNDGLPTHPGTLCKACLVDACQSTASADQAGCRPNRVHHRTYERLCNEQICDLTTLCADCHCMVTDMLRRRRYVLRSPRFADVIPAIENPSPLFDPTRNGAPS